MDKLVTQPPFQPAGHLHGGRLQEAIQRFRIPAEEWLDLSTGINPHGWQPQDIPAQCWARLPEHNDGLEVAAAEYYGCHQLLMTAGSQAVIQLLPALRPQLSTIGLFSPSYYEHELAWEKAGHKTILCDEKNIDLDVIDVLIVVNPNNPTGRAVDPLQLLDWHETLSAKGGWLIVDEAFIDTQPELSLTPFCPQPNLIVLRSLGKFFGLAGVRCGSVFAEPDLLKKIDHALGPWTLSTPTRWVAKQAFMDNEWQQKNVTLLKKTATELALVLTKHFSAPAMGTALFQTVRVESAEQTYARLGEQGILVRAFPEHQLIRFGLPATPKEMQTLATALDKTVSKP